MLEARRFDAGAALEAGIVDAVGEVDAVLKLIEERGLVAKGTKGSYGLLKEEMYKEVIALLGMKGPGVLGPSELRDTQQEEESGGTEAAQGVEGGSGPEGEVVSMLGFRAMV